MKRSSTLSVLLMCALGASAGAKRAHAQSLPEDVGPRDWAISLPACAMGESAERAGPLLLLYPRPGLPAVVHAGASLFARIRMPSALTPPPGHQQDKALRGFSAELIASNGTSISAARSRYDLRVVDVRPDTGATLVYRLRLPIPEWVAPGIYSLRVGAPSSGERVSVASVRVLARGAVPRLVALDQRRGLNVDTLRRRLAALEGYPADVLVAEPEPELEVALNAAQHDARWPPVLLVSTPRASGLLRVGEALTELGACSGPAYARQRHARLQAEHIANAPTLRSLVTHDVALATWWRTETLGEPTLRRSERDAAVVLRAGLWLPRPAEVQIVVPEDGLATSATGMQFDDWWPGTRLFATAANPSLVGRMTLPAGSESRMTRRAGPRLTLRLRANPATATTGQDVLLSAETSRPAQVAWRLAEDVTAVGAGARHHWAVRDRVEVHALAVDPDGVSARASLALNVETQRTGLCSSSGLPGGHAGRGPDTVGACILAVLWTFRRRQHRMRRARE